MLMESTLSIQTFPHDIETIGNYEVNFILRSVDSTNHLASLIASKCNKGDVITLQGDLGTGKTTFARGFINSFFPNKENVNSPSFNILQTYNTPQNEIWHYDLYRIKNKNELNEIGLDEGFSKAISVIEWPEMVAGELPKNRLEINLGMSVDNTSRKITLVGVGYWSKLLREMFS